MGLLNNLTNVIKKTIPPYKRIDAGDLKTQLTTTDPTPGYKSQLWYSGRSEIIEDLPFFRLWHAEMMKADPIVRQSLNIRDAFLCALEVEVDAKNNELREFIGKQFQALWNFAPVILKTKRYGYLAMQLDFTTDKTNGYTIIESLKAFAPQDSKPAVQAGKVVGIFVSGGQGTRPQSIHEGPILNPRGLWTTFDAEFGMKFGQSILKRSFGPWWEKWMDHGSKKTTQLRMIKDAYRGDHFTYPPNQVIQLPDGRVVPWSDIMRQMGENSMSGSMMTFPAMYDENGNKLTEYTPPSDTGNPSAIWTWGENLDRDIRAGLDIPEEIIQAATTGSGYSGRSIPLLAALGACDIEAKELLKAIDQQVLRPLAWMNFGADPEYTIKAVKLIDTFAEAVGNSQIGGEAMGGGQESNGQPRPQAQFEQTTGARGGIQARNIETGTTVGGQRAQEILARQ